MRVLSSDELQTAETALFGRLPKCAMVYGYVFAVNRGKPHRLQVLVDTWPTFTTVIVRSSLADCVGKVAIYSTNEKALRRILTEENGVDWRTNLLIRGCDVQHSPILKEISASMGFSMKVYSMVHLMTLSDSSHLHDHSTSDLESKVSVLNESHADLVNKTWKFGGDDKGYSYILNLIQHFPTCCITDDNHQIVSWVLLYDYCAIGMLYTLPEYRGKGYAKSLVARMATHLHSQGYPVYCFIEEFNHPSYNLFTSLGFTEDPSYRAGWYECAKG
ncbi:hypothetical protein DNTS_015945 [Danionella cerebrum]|uniref:Glycine N-acyltransferase-like protein n=1 Tax=Danionella cerebrum TaxID=2873325 RepID=A0A553R1T9_9TELE|nr:hypothetical protein DNTS_015945 [Danionella translucida]